MSNYRVAKYDETGWQGIVIKSKFNIKDIKKCSDPDGCPAFIKCKME